MVSSFLAVVLPAIATFSRGVDAFANARRPAVSSAPARCETSGNARPGSGSSASGESFRFGSTLAMSVDRPSDVDSGRVRYLGSGNDAVIRPGVVLVAPTHEYDHFLMKSAVFIYAIGLDEDENTILRGVVVDHPTAFSIGEMSPAVAGGLSDNPLFRGGYDGDDGAMLLHSAGGADGAVRSSGDVIGDSGVFEGGIAAATEAVDAGTIDPGRCKFFFGRMQFTAREIEDMFAGTEDGDEWASLEVPAEYVLDSSYGRSDLWHKLRNNIREFRRRP